MVHTANKRLLEQGNADTHTWFREYAKVFTHDDLLGAKEIVITSEEKDASLQNIYTSKSVIGDINSKLASSDLGLPFYYILLNTFQILKKNFQVMEIPYSSFIVYTRGSV